MLHRILIEYLQIEKSAISLLLPAHGLRRGGSVFSVDGAIAYHILPPPASHPARPFLFVNRKLLIDFHLRYTQLFANAFHCHFLYVWMTWNRSEISI